MCVDNAIDGQLGCGVVMNSEHNLGFGLKRFGRLQLVWSLGLV